MKKKDRIHFNTHFFNTANTDPASLFQRNCHFKFQLFWSVLGTDRPRVWGLIRLKFQCWLYCLWEANNILLSYFSLKITFPSPKIIIVNHWNRTVICIQRKAALRDNPLSIISFKPAARQSLVYMYVYSKKLHQCTTLPIEI